MNKVNNIIQQLKSETDGDEIFNILIDCGKNLELLASEKNELIPTILEYCDYDDEIVRSAAIRVLCFYWNLKEFRGKALKMYNNANEDEGTKSDALFAWSHTYKGTMSKNQIEFLLSILKEKGQSKLIRETSYNGILAISDIPPKDWPNKSINWDDFENGIDWNLLDKILKDAK